MEKKNFWKKWKNFVNPRTLIVTNPPFDQDWLEPFFRFVCVLDHPFLLILNIEMANRLYFGEHLYDQIQRRSELHIFNLQRCFYMKQKGGRVRSFSGLTICAYYPTKWNFILDEEQFERVITIKSLHGK